MNPSKYTSFTLQDFLADDDFIQWPTHPDEASNTFWQSFMAEHPQQKDIVEQAAETIRLYRAQDTFYNEAHKDLLWKKIAAAVAADRMPVQRKKIFALPLFLRVAAAVIIVAGLSLFIINRHAPARQYAFSTAFGEIKTISLPDQSTVTLNGNSSIAYSSNWTNQLVREVWIKGEGYFNVTHINRDSTHIQPGERFIVHCGDVNIEVLGTTFNVKARRGKTNVALITGKIRIDYTNAAISAKAVTMAPGDYVVYDAGTLVTNKKLPKPAQVTTWTANEISFTNATLKEITETLQDNYGYMVTMKDSSLLSLKIEGDISVSSVTDLLDVVSTSLDIKIDQPARNHITISK